MFISLNNTTNNEHIFRILTGGIAFSLLVWPLAATLISVALFLYWLFITKKSITRSSLYTILLLSSIYIVAVIGVLYSENQKEALFKIQQKSPLFIFPLLFGTAHFITHKTLKYALAALTLSVIILCLYFFGVQLTHFLTKTSITLTGYDFIAFPQTSPSSFTTLAVFALVYLLTELFSNNPVLIFKNKYFIAGFCILIISVIMLSGNRICILLASIFVFIKVLQKSKHKLLASSMLLLALFTFALSNSDLRKKTTSLIHFSSEAVIQLDEDRSLGKSWDGSSLRIAIWRCGIGLAKQSPMLGVGTGDVQDRLQQTYEERKFYFASRYNKYNAHNQFLQQLLSNGIAGVLLLVLQLVFGFYIAVSHKKELYLYFLIIFSTINLTESFLEHNKGILWYSLFNSLFIFTSFNHKQHGYNA